MNIAGVALLILGAALLLAGMTASGAASYSDTLNIGLLNDKSNLVMLGGFVWLSGMVLFVGAAMVDALKKQSDLAGLEQNSAGVGAQTATSTFSDGAF